MSHYDCLCGCGNISTVLLSEGKHMGRRLNEFKKELKEESSSSGVPLPDFLLYPTKTDKILWACFFLISILGFVMIPLRLWFINNPEWYALIVGGYTSATLLGAEHSQTGGKYIFVLLTIIGACKFYPLYYCMGKQWGRDLIEYFSTSMSLRFRTYVMGIIDNKPEKLKVFTFWCTPLVLLPGIRISSMITIPLMVIATMRKRTIALINIMWILVVNSVFFLLGYIFGEQVLDVIKIINKYAGWVFMVLIIMAIVAAGRQSWKNADMDDNMHKDNHTE